MYFTTGEKERTGPEAVPESARSSAESSMKIAKYIIAVPVNTKDLNNAVSGVKFKIVTLILIVLWFVANFQRNALQLRGEIRKKHQCTYTVGLRLKQVAQARSYSCTVWSYRFSVFKNSHTRMMFPF